MLIQKLKSLLPISYSKCVTHIRRRYSSASLFSHTLIDYFGITPYHASAMIKRLKIQTYNNERLLENFKLFRAWGFDNKDLLNNPRLIVMNTLQLEQRYLYMKETGFSNINPYSLAIFRQNNQKQIEVLKNEEYIPHDLNVPRNLLTYLKPLPDNFDISDLNDKKKLCDVHLTITKRYLKWRLSTTSDEIERLFRIYKMIQNKSLDYLSQNLALAEELGFTNAKILRSGYILHCYPKYTKTMLNDFPNFAGGDLRKAMKSYPKLFMVSPKNYLKIYGILKEFKIPDEFIQKTMNVFSLSPVTVKLRLEEIYSVPDLRVLFNNPHVLQLIIHHNRARSRFSFLQQLELKCTSLFLLGNDNCSAFDSHVREGRDNNVFHEVVTFLKSLFNNPSNEIKIKIKKHPFHLHIPLVRIEETYHYLLQLKFKKHALYKVVQILLYPKEHIEKALIDVKNNTTVKDNNLTQVQKLNLLLYYMEKEHHFTGNGVWLKTDEKILEQ